MGKVLVTGRRRHFDRVLKLAQLLYPGKDFDLWSDERRGGRRVNWIGPYFYKYEKNSLAELIHQTPQISSSKISEIIARCRYLRNIDSKKAEKLARACFLAWKEILESHKYEYIFTLPVDAYTTDTLCIAAELTGIKAVAPVTTPFDARIRFSLRGEFHIPRRLQSKSVQECLPLVQDYIDKITNMDYRASVLMGIDTPVKETILRRLVIDSAKPPYFMLYRFFARDPLSFSFPVRGLCKQTMFATPSRAWWANKISSAAQKELPQHYIFIPLQFYPEATTDYWIKEVEMCDHHQSVLALVDAVQGKYPVVIKEHPTAVGRRDSEFLKKLYEKSVIFADTLLPTGDLVSKAALVAGGGSTTMLQALLCKRPALFLGTPFYGAGGANILKRLDDPEHTLEMVEQSMKKDIYTNTDEYIRPLVNYYISSTPGRLGHYKIIGESSKSQAYSEEIPEETVNFLKEILREG